MSQQTVPMQLPFAINAEWRVMVGNNQGTHIGANVFCWDFGVRTGDNKGQPVYAVAPGPVVDVHLEKGWFYVQHAAGECFAYLHCLIESVLVHVGDQVQTGQHLAGVGQQGAPPGHYHLHVALSNIVGKLPEEGGNPEPFETIPAQFSDYEVYNESLDLWEQVAVGVPLTGQILRNPPRWSGWRSELGPGTLSSGPAAVLSGGNVIHVFAEADDRNIWHNFWSSQAWSGWRSDFPKGTFSSGPAAIVDAGGHIHVFARGDDRNIWHSFWNGKIWSGWQADLGIGTFQSGPCAVVSGGDNIHVFAQGDDRNMWHSFWNGKRWSGWQSEMGPGSFKSGPSAVMSGGGIIHLFALGDDRHNVAQLLEWRRMARVELGYAQRDLHLGAGVRGYAGWSNPRILPGRRSQHLAQHMERAQVEHMDG